MHIHPLSHEATFNLESILAWEKKDVIFLFPFFFFRTTKRPQHFYSYTHGKTDHPPPPLNPLRCSLVTQQLLSIL